MSEPSVPPIGPREMRDVASGPDADRTPMQQGSLARLAEPSRGEFRGARAPAGGFPRSVRLGAAVFVLLALALFTGLAYREWRRVPSAMSARFAGLARGAADLKRLDTAGAAEEFKAVRDAGATGTALHELGPLFGGLMGALGGLRDVAGEGIAVAGEVDYLKQHALDFLLGDPNADLLSHMTALRDDLAHIDATSAEIASEASSLHASTGIPPDAFSLAVDLKGTEQALDAALAWLTAPVDRHLAVLFGNSSEVRPGGGFVGSFADLALRRGRVASSTEVRNITDADRALSVRVIPPAPLRAVVARWGAADANWFFDFPASASKVLWFLDRSALFRNSSTTFDGAIAVSPGAVRDLLALTGPLAVPGLGQVDKDNFLLALQAQVEAGQSSGSASPKAALQAFASSLARALASLPDDRKQELPDLVRSWIERKDLLAYAADPALEEMLVRAGAAGDAYVPPAGFEGDYLAVAGANVGGGKSDIFMDERIRLESQIGNDGVVNDHLVVDRAHRGNANPSWWYQLPNASYFQVFIPADAALANFSGGTLENIPFGNYLARGFAADPDLARIEAATKPVDGIPGILSYNDRGVRAYATWSTVEAGGKARLVFDYARRLSLPPADGVQYQFVFEKQAATARQYEFEVSAPVGFRFAENNLPVWTYAGDDPPGRLVETLTLKRIKDISIP